MFGLGGKQPEAGARAKRASDTRKSRLRFVGLNHEVALEDSEDLHKSLSVVMPDWQATIGPAEVAQDITLSTIRRELGGTFSFQSWWGENPLTGLGIAGATCGAIADITQALEKSQA